ncbi:GNAT family N-acetyltransferase [Frondihabitans australicus]|uniref:RimJ/RimL family protein N-acetyltransferase n=1 Tax=Frondihabitans australicus TaxID=386892 RepID=A0A495IEU8_9MICO|nr:GNAT family N-acetyltransferase [Frondihabitans australicus]RKR74524.1 RimJ/RimL family protein N-acetyltransferase [Frondihabitans australicus]
MPFPLETDRLTIAPLAHTHAEAFVAYRRDPEVARYQSWGTDYSLDDATRLIDGQHDGRLPMPGHWLQLAVQDRRSAELLGDLALHRSPDQPDTFEIGMTLAPAAQHRGIAFEAVEALLEFVFEQEHAHRVTAFCDSRNAPVARLLTRLGFRHESTAVEADWFKDEWTTLEGYALLAREREAAAL